VKRSTGTEATGTKASAFARGCGGQAVHYSLFNVTLLAF